MTDFKVDNVSNPNGANVVGVAQMNDGPIYAGGTNRVINGLMEIDQVNEGTAVTNIAAGNSYLTDMFGMYGSVAGKITAQQVADAPAGMKNSLKFTVAAQYAPAATDNFMALTAIEGKDVIDFKLGTSGAATFTLSKWMKASVAGNYAVQLRNAAANRSYIALVAVTTSWTQPKVTLLGDITGTWLTDNGMGLVLCWDLGSGTNYNGTANVWQAGNLTRTSGSVTFVNQAVGATLQITGVDVRLGSMAPSTPERRPNEIGLCQRYYNKSYGQGVKPGTATTTGQLRCVCVSGAVWFPIQFPTEMRVAPSVSVYSPNTGTVGKIYDTAAGDNASATAEPTTRTAGLYGTGSTGSWAWVHYAASARMF